MWYYVCAFCEMCIVNIIVHICKKTVYIKILAAFVVSGGKSMLTDLIDGLNLSKVFLKNDIPVSITMGSIL